MIEKIASTNAGVIFVLSFIFMPLAVAQDFNGFDLSNSLIDK